MTTTSSSSTTMKKQHRTKQTIRRIRRIKRNKKINRRKMCLFIGVNGFATNVCVCVWEWMCLFFSHSLSLSPIQNSLAVALIANIKAYSAVAAASAADAQTRTAPQSIWIVFMTLWIWWWFDETKIDKTKKVQIDIWCRAETKTEWIYIMIDRLRPYMRARAKIHHQNALLWRIIFRAKPYRINENEPNKNCWCGARPSSRLAPIYQFLVRQ